jgi:hypothetical protein
MLVHIPIESGSIYEFLKVGGHFIKLAYFIIIFTAEIAIMHLAFAYRQLETQKAFAKITP